MIPDSLLCDLGVLCVWYAPLRVEDPQIRLRLT